MSYKAGMIFEYLTSFIKQLNERRHKYGNIENDHLNRFKADRADICIYCSSLFTGCGADLSFIRKDSRDQGASFLCKLFFGRGQECL